MTGHLTDDVVARLALTGPDEPDHRRHLDDCADCRTRMAVWQDIGTAVRAEAAEQAVAPPSFDALLGPALAGSKAGAAGSSRGGAVPARARPGSAVPARARAVSHPWRTAWHLAVRQAALMPRAWAPLSAAGFAGAALAASAGVQDRFAVRLFGAVVVLLVLLGALMVVSPRRDPRWELLYTVPVPPAAVFLARLTVVLCVDLALATVCSALVDGPGWWPVVSSWLGESLLAASLALALSVRFAPAGGAAAGGALWLLGVVSGPQGLVSTPIDAVSTALLATTPWTVALAAALLAWTTTALRSFGPAASPR